MSSKIRRQRGSAYLLALLVLAVLMMLGLSLALVTQTEIQIAANERASVRLFYAADAAIAAAIALVMTKGDLNDSEVGGDLRCQDVVASDSVVVGATEIVEVVEITPIVQLAQTTCNLCEFPTDEGKVYVKTTHAVRNDASQVATSGSDTQVLTQKSVGTMLDFEPYDEAKLKGMIDQLYNDPRECGIANLGHIL